MSKAAKTVKPLSEEEKQLLQGLLTRLQETGSTMPVPCSSWTAPVGGAMTDACKRNRDDGVLSLDEDDDDTYQYVSHDDASTNRRTAENSAIRPCSSHQLPVPPSTGDSVVFPPGVTSLEDWSTTVCELPKVASLDMTYGELVASGKHNEYLLWVLNHGLGRSGRLGDLANYLCAIQFGMQNDPKATYPDSKSIRKKKSS